MEQNIEKLGWSYEGKPIKEIKLAPLGLGKYIEVLTKASTSTKNRTEAAVNKQINRNLLAEQVQLIAVDGTELRLKNADVAKLPLAIGVTLQNLLNEADLENGEAGTVTLSGDGVSQRVTYQLAKPMKLENGAVEALEFQAQTYGEIENVIAEPQTLKRVLLLITECSIPIITGDDSGKPLLRTPSYIAENLSLADGLAIAQEVAPRFLSPQEI